MTAPRPDKKRVVFVDDEPSVLKGLRGLLRKQRHIWAMEFLGSAKEALTSLRATPADVIVTDMRMPTIDGATLLKQVQADHSNTVRIVLSGYAEEEAVMRAVPVTHQFLSKPCPADRLQNVIERACTLQRLISDDRMRGTVGMVSRLPPLPRIYSALTSALADPNSDATTISRILERDPAMCAKLLQLVNSAFFATAMPISNIAQAVMRLGFEMVKNLALSLAVFENLLGKRVRGLSHEHLQQHSVRVANLARKMLPDRRQADDAFMAAMLHDVGQLVMASTNPKQLTKALAVAAKDGIALHVAEQQVFGVTHAHVGAYLLGIWGLPYPIVEAVAFHHTPEQVASDQLDVVSAIAVAEMLVQEGASGPAVALEHTELSAAYLERDSLRGKLDGWRAMLRDGEDG